ncbi:MAG: DNA translocase FtsK [Dehalococcoidia bacterium]|nr:DNA translocase FtsK [Dehalococcoidia bacterium]MDD5493330.1 DNA translocase FtsK [Dehalococcoidia bacterium]
MPARKSRGNNKQGSSQKNSKKGSLGSSSLKFLFSPPVILAFLFVLAICLAIAFWPAITDWLNRLSEDTMATINAAWLSLLQSTGLGIIFIIVAVISLILILSNPRIFSRNWNYWLGAIAFAVAAWGLFSYIKPDSGMFAQASLGGSIGKSIVTDSPVAGLLILTGLILVGIFLVAPEWLWGVVKRTSKGTAGLAGEIVDVVKESRSNNKTVPEEIEEEAPIAVEQREELPVPVDTAVMDRMRSSIVVGGWSLPNINILDKVQEAVISDEEIDKRRETIEEALASYGVQAKVIEVNRGPTVTQFGVEPGWDIKYKEVREKDRDGNVSVRQEEAQRTRVKVERISSLANDLALALAAPSIRIEAPVPGKSVVGIEVPNTTFGSVGLRGVMESTAFQKMLAKSRLAIALGKGAGGETVVADMTKAPHLLIAGATGSGKSVCLNSIICCLMMNNTPDSVKYIMIDPKRVELVNYNSIPHLISPVVVDTDKAIMALRWLNAEMDIRYKRFSATGQRNIEGYNKNRAPADCMPYIIVVIDELADLMMAAFDEVERTLCRLAQLARATGIHLIVATQRPSVDVVTGLIKANFPTRITFALTSQVDSRTIIDSAGAEKLLGRGDMLYMPQDVSKPKRLQGTMVSDAEIERLVNFWGNQKRQEAQSVRFEDMAQATAEGKKQPEDELLETARQLALESKEISASFLQRKLQIGFPRAARLMDKLREEGFGKEKGEG